MKNGRLLFIRLQLLKFYSIINSIIEYILSVDKIQKVEKRDDSSCHQKAIDP